MKFPWHDVALDLASPVLLAVLFCFIPLRVVRHGLLDSPVGLSES